MNNDTCLVCSAKRSEAGKIVCKMCNMAVDKRTEAVYMGYNFCSEKCRKHFSEMSKRPENAELLKRNPVI